MFKELLNKMKIIKKICDKKKKYVTGGFIQPVTQQFEIETDEKILTLEELNSVLHLSEALQNCREAALKAGISMCEMKIALNKMLNHMQSAKRREANNWRKMHGLPMRRKTGGKGKWSNRN